MEHEAAGASGGMSRRDLIRRGAVVGGAAIWVSPVVQSFTSPAFAQVGTPPETSPGGEECPDGMVEAIGAVKWDPEATDGPFVPIGRGANGQGNCLANPDLCGGAPPECESLDAHLASHFNAEAEVVVDGERVCITLPPHCSAVHAAGAKEGNPRDGSPCDCTPDAGTDLSSGIVCFEKDNGGGVGHIELVVTCCVPAGVVCD